MTWGVPASPEQTSPESLSSLPPDLCGQTDPRISGSWLEWGPCWFSSAVSSPGRWTARQPWSAEQGTPSTSRCVAAGFTAVPAAGLLGPDHWLVGRGPGPLVRDGKPQARGGAATWPALSGTGSPAGKGEGGTLQARDLCVELSTVVPVQCYRLPV